MTTRYALVGCGDEKRSGVLPARAKYCSTYFEEKLRFADTFCDRWWILSAEHGILNPDTEIGDYDTHISDLSDQELDHWARGVYCHLRACDLKWMVCDQLYVLLGQEYIDAIQHILDGLAGMTDPVEVVYPFDETRGNGDQRSWLIESVETRDPTPTDPEAADSDSDQATLEVFG